MKVKNISGLYKQLYNDLEYILNEYGEVYDFCGSWCNSDLFRQLLKKPNTKTAFTILITKVKQYFEGSYGHSFYDKLPINDDKKLQKIKEKWIDIYYEID